jgi:hypothetical protein
VSVTAVGPALDLDGPLPVARRHSLLRTPTVDVVYDDEGRWLNGVNVIGYPDGPPLLWEPCSTGTFRVKEDGSEAPQNRFDPIAVYVALPCSTLGMGDFDMFARRAELVLEATLSHGIEEALAAGVALSNNPFLGDNSLTALAGGAAVSPRIGLAYLDNAIGELTARQGVIHATPAVVDRWGEGQGLRLADEIRSPAGTPIVSGSGYIGVDPVGKTASGATTEWAFATGPVDVRVSPFVSTSVDETVDRSDNSVVVRAERYSLVDWDTALQVGVLIDWSIT